MTPFKKLRLTAKMKQTCYTRKKTKVYTLTEIVIKLQINQKPFVIIPKKAIEARMVQFRKLTLKKFFIFNVNDQTNNLNKNRGENKFAKAIN